MNTCFKCSNLPSFVCRCSENTSYYCKYHVGDHEIHPELKFVYNKFMKNNLDLSIHKLEEIILNLNSMRERLSDSEKKLILTVNNAYSQTLSRIDTSKNDIQKSIDFLKDLKYNCETDYLTAIKFVIDPSHLIEDYLVSFFDNTNTIHKKINSNLKFESLTENLMKHQDYSNYDKLYFEFELEKKFHRDSGLSLIKGLPNQDLENFSKILNSNISKRQYNLFTIPNNISLDYLDIYHTISKLSKKAYHFNFINSELDNEGNMMVLQIAFTLFKIQHLNLKNSIKNESQCRLLMSALRSKKSIKYLNLALNGIIDNLLDDLLDCFCSYIEKVRNLNLAKNFFSKCGCEILNKYLPGFTGLRELNISYNDIDFNGILMINDGLSRLKCLEELNIKNNYLGAEGIEVLMEAIAGLPRLSVLNVSNNDYGDEGVLIIANYVKYMKMLMILYIDYLISVEVMEILCSVSYEYTKIVKYKNRNDNIVAKAPSIIRFN